MKVDKGMVKLEDEPRGGDSPYGWSEDAIHLKVFGMRVETYRESHRHLAQRDAVEWVEAITNWKSKKKSK